MDSPWEKPMGQPGEFAWLLDGGSLLPSFTSFPLPPPLPPLFGPPAAWTDAGAPPEPARPVLTPLELVIHDRSLGGWVTLAYSPGVDLTQPIALVLDDRRLGPVTIGWITPADLADPHATTIRLTHETQPLPGHQSLHRPEEAAVVKAGYDAAEGADRSSGEVVEDAYPSADAGSDAPAKARASFLWELGNSLNPISTAKAAGPEEDERGFEEFLDPLAPVRIARFNSLLVRLRQVDPGNPQNVSLTGPDFIPSEENIRQVEEALEEAIRRNDPPAEPPTAQPPAGRSTLSIRPPRGSPHDVVVEFGTESDLRAFMRRGGASEPEIDAAVERFRRQQEPVSPNNPSSTERPPSARDVVQERIPLGFTDQRAFREFGSDIRTYLARRGYDDVVPMIRGSAVTGIRHDSGLPFDVGEHPSDFDLALVSPELLNRAKGLGIPLRSRGTRTGPLSDSDLKNLGLIDLVQSLSQKAGRDVTFMIYSSVESVTNRGPSYTFGD